MHATHSIDLLAARLPPTIRELAGPAGHPFAAALPRWTEAARRLDLTTDEWTLGATLLALELEPTLRHQDASGPRTRAELLAMASDQSGQDNLAALASLEARAIVCGPKSARGGWLGGAISLDERVRAFCIGLNRGSRFVGTHHHPLAPRVATRVAELAAICRERGHHVHVVLRGHPGAGHGATAAALLVAIGQLDDTRTPLELRTAHDPLEPALSGRIAVWDARNGDLQPDDLTRAEAFLGRSHGVCVSLLGARQDAPSIEERALIAVNLDPIDYPERRALWHEALRAHVAPDHLTPLVDQLAAQTRAGAALVARVTSTVEAPDRPSAASWCATLRERLDDAVQPSQAQGVNIEYPTARFEDLIVADVTRSALETLTVMAEHAWSLARPHRAGVKGLFAGPPGTGKTLAARALAGHLSRPLYRVDLASITSKWVGETEKNLRRVLAAAETAGAVLLFDEGDALFGRRGNVDRGSDRYANLEVAFLLQALEELDGILLVTTNLRANLDPAFTRRFDLCLDFARPEAEHRLALWRQELGEGSVSDELLRSIAHGVELTGGHIAVACRLAHALALADQRTIGDQDVIRGLVTELRNTGNNIAAARWEQRLRAIAPHTLAAL